MRQFARIFSVLTLSLILLFTATYGSAMVLQNEAAQEAEGKTPRELTDCLSNAKQNYKRPLKSKNKSIEFVPAIKAEKVVSQVFSVKNAIFIRYCMLLI